jgi:hypothetical protein
VETTSEHLAQQIAAVDEDEELRAEGVAEWAAERESLLESVEHLYRSSKPTVFTMYAALRKATNKLPSGQVQNIGDATFWRAAATWFLDDSFSRLMVAEIPRMVSRALQLEPVIVDQTARADENPYLREATRCYLFGLFSASVALSRSALEYALSKKIPTLLQGKEDRLQTLVKTARNSVLKRAPEICNLADEIRKRANIVVHKKNSRESQALEVLRDTRKVLQFLYGKAC